MVNSLKKYNKTRDPASANAVHMMRTIKLKTHPLLQTEIDETEEEAMKFKESLKAYKPKQSALEVGIIKTHDFAKIDKFQKILEL